MLNHENIGPWNDKTWIAEFWKTNQIFTLGQLRFIGPANSYTHALRFTMPLPGLAD